MTDADLKRLWSDYDRDGYVVVRGFLSAGNVEALGAATDRVAAAAEAKGADWRHGNLHYRLAPDVDGTMRVRMAQWMAYAFPAFDEMRCNARYPRAAWRQARQGHQADHQPAALEAAVRAVERLRLSPGQPLPPSGARVSQPGRQLCADRHRHRSARTGIGRHALSAGQPQGRPAKAGAGAAG